jgi:hypothetical protein
MLIRDSKELRITHKIMVEYVQNQHQRIALPVRNLVSVFSLACLLRFSSLSALWCVFFSTIYIATAKLILLFFFSRKATPSVLFPRQTNLELASAQGPPYPMANTLK